MTHDELLKEIESYHQKTDDNVIGVGYGYKTRNGIITDEKSIIFTVKEKIPIDQLTEEQLLPDNIIITDQKISTDVVQGQFKLLCDAAFYNWETVAPTNQNIFRPLKGGISCSAMPSMSASTGTFGFIAIDNDTNSLVGVSNNHVLVEDAFICSERNLSGTCTNIIGQTASQPHEYLNDNFPIGYVKKYYPIFENQINYIDTATVTISGATYINSGTSYNQEGLLPSTYPFATTSELDELLTSGSTSYNSLLYSAGRTTGAKGEGTTKLVVYAIAQNVAINYNRQGSNVTIDYSDLISFVATTGITQPISDICDYPINHGDSGSALIADISGTKKIIGLCFAGSTQIGLACRIDRVASLLNLSAWNGESVNYSSQTVEEVVVNGLSSEISLIISGKTYWQAGLRRI